ncbi:MAG: DUF362 domain-containing protein [Ignavibacteriales bacterium]|nr:MAG: DUF362 domain-containing protein [Ignavibacteriales bacterium]
MSSKYFSRREFIKTSALAAASSMVISSNSFLFGMQSTKTKVVLIRNEKVLDKNGKINIEILETMLDESVKLIFDTKYASTAWSKIIKPTDVVGIKTNVWNYLSTPTELENIIKERVIAAGVKEDNVSIDDRGVLNNPVFKKATALINSRPMRTHYWSGVGSLLKNYIMFAEKPSDYHDDSCADLAAIWKLPNVKDKTRLNILVMLTPLFHSVGAHGYSPEYVWQYKGLIVSTDPVAADSIGLKIIEAKRREFFKEDKPLNPPAKHIALADTRHHLGTADIKKIDLIMVGWKEKILI